MERRLCFLIALVSTIVGCADTSEDIGFAESMDFDAFDSGDDETLPSDEDEDFIDEDDDAREDTRRAVTFVMTNCPPADEPIDPGRARHRSPASGDRSSDHKGQPGVEFDESADRDPGTQPASGRVRTNFSWDDGEPLSRKPPQSLVHDDGAVPSSRAPHARPCER